jgi:hypothetical protein
VTDRGVSVVGPLRERDVLRARLEAAQRVFDAADVERAVRNSGNGIPNSGRSSRKPAGSGR